MSEQENRWADVAAAISARMKELKIDDQAHLIRLSKLSEPTVRALVTGEPRSREVKNGTDAKLCRALGWKMGGLYRLLAGEQPEIDEDAIPATEDLTVDMLAAQIEERFDALERAMNQKLDELAELGVEVVKNLNRLQPKPASRPSKRTARPQS